MKLVWTEAFAEGYDEFSLDDQAAIYDLLDDLEVRHTGADMRETLRLFPGIELWSTAAIALSRGRARVTWSYDDDRTAIILIAVAYID